MGDRIYTSVVCPTCDKMIEQYDAPSSLLHCCKCEHCGYDDGLDYYEKMETYILSEVQKSMGYPTVSYEIRLCSKEDALKTGWLYECPVCKGDMTQPDSHEYGKCYNCLKETRKKSYPQLIDG